MISQCRGSSSSLAKTAETIEISGSKVPSLLANIRNKLSLAGSSQNLPRISGGSFERSAYGTPRGVANAVRWCCGARNGTRLCRATRHGCGLKSPLRRPGFRRMLQTCVTPSLIGCLQIRCCCDVRPDYWSNRDGRDPAPAIPSDCRQGAIARADRGGENHGSLYCHRAHSRWAWEAERRDKETQPLFEALDE